MRSCVAVAAVWLCGCSDYGAVGLWHLRYLRGEELRDGVESVVIFLKTAHPSLSLSDC